MKKKLKTAKSLLSLVLVLALLASFPVINGSAGVDSSDVPTFIANSLNKPAGNYFHGAYANPLAGQGGGSYAPGADGIWNYEFITSVTGPAGFGAPAGYTSYEPGWGGGDYLYNDSHICEGYRYAGYGLSYNNAGGNRMMAEMRTDYKSTNLSGRISGLSLRFVVPATAYYSVRNAVVLRTRADGEDSNTGEMVYFRITKNNETIWPFTGGWHEAYGPEGTVVDIPELELALTQGDNLRLESYGLGGDGNYFLYIAPELWKKPSPNGEYFRRDWGWDAETEYYANLYLPVLNGAYTALPNGRWNFEKLINPASTCTVQSLTYNQDKYVGYGSTNFHQWEGGMLGDLGEMLPEMRNGEGLQARFTAPAAGRLDMSFTASNGGGNDNVYVRVLKNGVAFHGQSESGTWANNLNGWTLLPYSDTRNPFRVKDFAVNYGDSIAIQVYCGTTADKNINLGGIKFSFMQSRWPVSLDGDGGDVPQRVDDKYHESDYAWVLPTPTRARYDFLGWYYADDPNQETFFGIPPHTTGELWLRAKWVSNRTADEIQLKSLLDQANGLLSTAVEGSAIGEYSTGSKTILSIAVRDAQMVYDASVPNPSAVTQQLTALGGAITAFQNELITEKSYYTALLPAMESIVLKKRGYNLTTYPDADYDESGSVDIIDILMVKQLILQ